jgi:predicted RNA-binding protein
VPRWDALLPGYSNKGGKEMCELKVLLLKDGERKTIMESVTKMVVVGGSIELYSILGEKETVAGSIKEVDFSKGETIIIGK